MTWQFSATNASAKLTMGSRSKRRRFVSLNSNMRWHSAMYSLTELSPFGFSRRP